MKKTVLVSALFASLVLVACDRPAVVAVPVAAPGATGAAGPTGATGTQGTPGKTGEGTTVVVVPPAASAPN
jgi:hypothetical protein